MSPLPIDTDALPALGPESAGMLMTPEEFDEVTDYDDGYRYELIRGVLVVTPIPAEAEASPNDELGAMFRQYQREHPQGAALDEPLPERYVRTSIGRRRADRVVWLGLGRRPDPATDAPAIVVEFVSALRRDRRRDYEEKSVPDSGWSYGLRSSTSTSPTSTPWPPPGWWRCTASTSFAPGLR